MSYKGNIFQVFRPFYYITKLCGYIPFTIYFEDKNRMITTKLDFAMMLYCFVFSIVSIRYALETLPKNDEQHVESMILVSGLSFGIFLTLSQTVLLPFINAFYRNRFIKFMKNIDTFDQKVRLQIEVELK